MLKNIKKNFRFSKYNNNKFINDYYFRKSKILNFRSRSWFKIYEIQKKYKVFNKYFNVIDLGSYPGGWSEFISNYISNKNLIFSCDIFLMKHINKVKFFQGDLTINKTYNNFIKFINYFKINVIVSDMSINMSGHNLIDNYKNINLLEIALKLCLDKLLIGGSFVLKLFQSNDISFFIKKISNNFRDIFYFKPNSSKSSSKEFYIIAKNFYKSNC